MDEKRKFLMVLTEIFNCCVKDERPPIPTL
nr:MAG TPA: hypothetical protein [Caudoviricetes sp.]